MSAKPAEESDREHLRLLTDQLAAKATQLATANLELEAFSYSVSHDLRAPLRHLQGYVSLLRQEASCKLSEKEMRYMDAIEQSALKMTELVENLLEFSRMGRVEMSREPVDLNLLAQESITQLEPEARGRRIKWKTAALPDVIGDAAMLRQVFINLLSNAIKYTRPRDPAEIEIGFDGKGDNQAVIFVRDNGVGFEMEYADKLFGVFQRMHSPDEFEGTGIGLANVRRIITRLDGRTWAESKVDAGATFYFSLPFVNAPMP